MDTRILHTVVSGPVLGRAATVGFLLQLELAELAQACLGGGLSSVLEGRKTPLPQAHAWLSHWFPVLITQMLMNHPQYSFLCMFCFLVEKQVTYSYVVTHVSKLSLFSTTAISVQEETFIHHYPIIPRLCSNLPPEIMKCAPFSSRSPILKTERLLSQTALRPDESVHLFFFLWHLVEYVNEVNRQAV